MPRIGTKCEIPDEELLFDTSRAQGPGGQNVNKVETRVSLEWDVRTSRGLTEAQRTLLLTRLSSRLIGDGILRLSCQDSRSQAQNRRVVVERFVELITECLKVVKKRVATRATRSSQRRRVDNKKRRSDVKNNRRQGGWD